MTANTQQKPVKRWLISIAGVVLVIAALAAFKVLEIMGAIAFAQSFPEPSETVEVHVVESAHYQAMQKVYAEVVAPRRLELRNELTGVVAEVGFAAGDSVEKGQLLLQQDVREEKARLRALKARELLASRTFVRNQTLYKEKRLSEQALDESRAELDSVRAEITQVQVQIDKKTLTAPFAAKAGIHHLEPGQLLPAQTHITTLIGVESSLWLEFELPQTALQLTPGDTIQVQTGGRELNATIIARDAELSDTSRNLRYRARLLDSDHGLLPHAVVNVQVPASQSQKVALIPDTALRVDQLGSYVYLLDEDEQGAVRANRRQVEVASRRNNEVAILSGLEEGDRIAGKGAFKLRDNIKVAISHPGAEPQS